jgi:RNA polymerase sigma-70 factor (ECF subfamily)
VTERDPGLAARIESALALLPAGYRAILVLHDVEGLSHEECAAILECRVGTCKSQLHKARARMRELLGPQIAGHREEDERPTRSTAAGSAKVDEERPA